MDLTFTEEQKLIQRTAREFLEARSPMSHVREMEHDPAGYSTELWKELVEFGCMGLPFPEEHGGFGLSFLDLCLLVEELGRHQTPSPFVGTVVCCALPIARHGTNEQKKAFIDPVVAGEEVMAYAAGAGLAARAEHGRYILDGELMFVPYAHVADHLVVVAHQEGSRDPIVCIVDTEQVNCERLRTIRPDHEHRVVFDGVTVGPDRVLGRGNGPSVTKTIEGYGTAAACAEMVGGAQKVLDMTVAYASQRKQFGRPVGSFQAVQHHCANMATDILGSRLIAYEAIWHLSEGREAAEQVSVAKAWVSEAYRRVCALGHQVHGAIGFTHEYDLHYYLRHAISAEATFGDADHHLECVAQSLGL